MTWEQKLAALQALGGECHLAMRSPGNWYVAEKGFSIGGDGMLTSQTQSEPSPADAVEECWSQHVTNLPANRYLAVEGNDSRKHFRWNGYMWQELPR